MTQEEKFLIKAGRACARTHTLPDDVSDLLGDLCDLAEKAIDERDYGTIDCRFIPQVPLTKGQMNALCQRVKKEDMPKYLWSVLLYEKDEPLESNPEDCRIYARDWCDRDSGIADDYGKDWVVFLAEPTKAELDAIEWDKKE